MAKRGSNSVAASAPSDRGPASARIASAAVNVLLYHGASPTVAGVELGDFFVVLGLVDLAVLECGGVFPELRLVGGLEFAQFAIGGGTADEEQSREKQPDEIENRFHVARRVRLVMQVVKQPSREACCLGGCGTQVAANAGFVALPCENRMGIK